MALLGSHDVYKERMRCEASEVHSAPHVFNNSTPTESSCDLLN